MHIYLITNMVNDKCYVGKTKLPIEERFQQHCTAAKKGPKFPLQKALKKYGRENFTCSLLSEATTNEELNRLEIHHIQEKKSHISLNGYNMTLGGDGGDLRSGKKNTKEQNALISQALKGNKNGEAVTFTEKRKQKISSALKGNTNSSGVSRSEDTKKAISKKMQGNQHGLGYRHTEEMKKHISQKLKGKNTGKGFKGKHSEETKKKLSVINTGKKMSQETKNKISRALQKYYNEK